MSTNAFIHSESTWFCGGSIMLCKIDCRPEVRLRNRTAESEARSDCTQRIAAFDQAIDITQIVITELLEAGKGVFGEDG